MLIIKFVLYLFLILIIMSINEWFVHRYFMHNKNMEIGISHLSHHKETNSDMSLKKNMKNLDNDKFRGTAFCYKTSISIFFIALIQILILWYLFFNKNYLIPIIITLIISAYQGIIWNSVHTQMHGMPSVDYNIGYPSLIPFEYLSFLKNNHVKHHHSKGTKYFNVTLPIADYIFGTF